MNHDVFFLNSGLVWLVHNAQQNMKGEFPLQYNGMIKISKIYRGKRKVKSNENRLVLHCDKGQELWLEKTDLLSHIL